jgi:diguanylate cyclase (GGDEF)-like protein/PAS domain S-box-containing protein
VSGEQVDAVAYDGEPGRQTVRSGAGTGSRPRPEQGTEDQLRARVAALEAQLAALVADRERAEGELRHSQVLLQAIADHAPHTITVQDVAEGRYLLVNRRQEELTGRNRDQLLGRPVTEVAPAQAPAWREQDRRIAASGESLQIEDVKRYPDGHEEYFLGLKFPLRDAQGEVYAIGGIFQDITERKAMERALRESEDRYRSVVEALAEGVVVLDGAGVIQGANPSAARLLGVPPDELRDRPLAELLQQAIREDGRPILSAELPAEVVLRTGEPQSGAVLGLPRPGSRATTWLALNAHPLRHQGEQQLYGVVSSFADITARRALEDQLRHQATHDALTGLPNRARFMAELERALAADDSAARTVGVCYLDLDHFKDVNDTHGHALGDSLLVAVAERLRCCLRTCDSVARLGGDEFTICLPDVAGHDEVTGVARRIVAVLGAPYLFGGRELRVTPSVGVALGTPGVHAPDDLLRQADAALYRAKARGRGRYVLSRGSASGTHARDARH